MRRADFAYHLPDALIAQLEQQANYFTNMFQTMRENQKSYS